MEIHPILTVYDLSDLDGLNASPGAFNIGGEEQFPHQVDSIAGHTGLDFHVGGPPPFLDTEAGTYTNPSHVHFDFGHH
jgi:hypothetical protein